jgi:hypothetical protein
MTPSPLARSSEREGKSLYSWILKLDCEDVVGDGSLLPHQLVQAMVCHDAIALRIGVYSMILPRSLAVNGHSETDRLPVGRRTQHKVQIASMKMKHDLPTILFDSIPMMASKCGITLA